MEGDKLTRTLGILGEGREFEATKSINAMTSAINPIMILIVGTVVGVLAMSIYSADDHKNSDTAYVPKHEDADLPKQADGSGADDAEQE